MGAQSATPGPTGGVSRRGFLRAAAATLAAASLASVAGAAGASAQTGPTLGNGPFPGLEEATIAQLQRAMEEGRLTSRLLVQLYLARIAALDRHGPQLNSVLEINPDAESIAQELDRERRQGHVRGPLHGIPVLLKDNIDTADRMMTTAGSLALVGDPPAQDATVARLLREAGAVLLGKTNLSEWANFRSFHSSSGWCGRNGQSRNPYILDRNPCGSSSGSGIAASAALCAASVGTETDGSIVCPAGANGVVGIKPTVGVTSRAGVIPIAHSQDTVGPHGRTVADAAVMLGGMASTKPDPRDPATWLHRDKVYADYTQFLDPNGLRGARIGVARAGVSGYSEETDRAYEAAIQAMRDAGAVIVDPADIPTIDQINEATNEIIVLVYEFKRDLNSYLATRTGVPIGSLADAIEFNLEHAEVELKWFLQEWFDLAESDPFSEERYRSALATDRRLGGRDGIDAVLEQYDLDALVAPTGSPAWTIDLPNGDHFLGASSSPAAIVGYPLISVPMGEAFGLPVGITFMGTAYSEPTLIKLASGFEAVTRARKTPTYRPTLPLDQPPGRAGGPRRRPTLPTGPLRRLGIL